MPTFKLTIDTDNDAFQDDSNEELANVLEAVALEVRYLEDNVSRGRSFPIYDSNGNSVGQAELLSE